MSFIGPEFIFFSLFLLAWPFEFLVVEVWLPVSMTSINTSSVAIVVLLLSIVLLGEGCLKVVIKSLQIVLGLLLLLFAESTHQVILLLLGDDRIRICHLWLDINIIPRPWVLNVSTRLEVWVSVRLQWHERLFKLQ